MKLRKLQKHHICYDPEITVIVTQGEHLSLTWLQRHKHITTGMVTAVKQWLHDNEHNAVDMTQMYELQKQWRGKK